MATEKTRAQLKAATDALLDNAAANGSIQPEADGDLREDAAKSAVNILDDRSLLNVREYDASRSKPYQIGEGFFRAGQLRQTVIEHSGAYNAVNSQPLTPAIITSVVTAYSAGDSLANGVVRSYEGLLFIKKNGTATGADPYDTFEFDAFNALLPYYGQQYVANQVYITGMVVRSVIGGATVLLRKVKPTGGSPEFIYSNDLAAELAADEWELELVGSVPTAVNILATNLTVNSDTFHEKRYVVLSGDYGITLGAASSGVRVYFYLKGGSVEFSGTVASLATTHSTLYIECCAISLGVDGWLVTQTQA